MNDHQAKKQLRRLLRSYTSGSLLHLLSDLYRDFAEQASRSNEDAAAEQFRDVAAALFIVGLGVDAVQPRPGK